MTIVINLSTQHTVVFSCSPREAVVAAYAQERGDFNTWQYNDRYGSLVQEGDFTFLCGDWSAFKDGSSDPAA